MTFDVKSARSAGYSDDEIADHLGQQSNFDVPAARKSGYGTNEIIDHLSGSDTPAAQRDLVEGVTPSTAGAGRGITRPAMGLGDARPSATPAPAPKAPTKGRSGSVLENVILDDPQLDPELNRQAMLQSRSPNSVMFTAGRGKQEADQAIEQAKRPPVQEMREAKPVQPRSIARAVGDTAIGLTQGALGMAKGVADNINAGDNPVSDFYEGAIKAGDRLKSDDLRDQQVKRDAQIYQAGKNGGEIGEARASFNTLFSQPGAGMDVVARGAGSMIPTVGLGLAGAGTKLMGATNALSNAGDAASQTADALRQLPPSAWQKNEDYRAMVNEGASHDEAVSKLAPWLALPAQIAGGATGFITGTTGLEKVLAGKAVGNSIAQRAGRAAVELGGEQLETLVPQMVGNTAVGELDGTTGITKGLGRAAVETAAGSLPGSALAAKSVATPDAQPSAEQIARQKGFLVREQRIKTLTDAGDTATADLLQKKHDRLTAIEEVDDELQRMPSTPEFANNYRNLRGTGMKPAEAAARSAVTTTFQGAAVAAGIPDAALATALEKANGMPLDEVPAFLQKFTAALEKRGLAQPGAVNLGEQLEMARDDAIEAAMGSVYQQGDIRNDMNDVLAMEGQGAPEAVDLQSNQPLAAESIAPVATENLAETEDQRKYSESVGRYNALASEYKTATEQRQTEIRPLMDALNREQFEIKAKVQRESMKLTQQAADKEASEKFGAMPVGAKIGFSEHPNNDSIYWEKTSDNQWTRNGMGSGVVTKPNSQMSGGRVIADKTPAAAPIAQPAPKPAPKPFAELPDLDPEQQQRLDNDLADANEREYQQSVKESIQTRLGLIKPTESDQKKTPFKTFLRQYGIAPVHTSDIAGKNRFKANNMLPATFRAGGLDLDSLVERAIERGFMTEADRGDQGKLISMIQSEIAGDAQVSTEFADDDAAAQTERAERMEIEGQADKLGLPYSTDTSTDQLASMVNRVQRRMEKEVDVSWNGRGTLKSERVLANAREVAARIERKRAKYNRELAQFAEATIAEQDALLEVLQDADGNPIIVRSSDLQAEQAWHEWQDINGTWDDQNEQTDTSAAGNSQETSTPIAGIAQEGAGNGAQAGPQEQRSGNGASDQSQEGSAGSSEGLTAPTRADIEAQQDQAEKAAKAKEAADRAADKAAAADEDRKRIAKASEAAAATFVLGGNALDNLTGQGSMFEPKGDYTVDAPRKKYPNENQFDLFLGSEPDASQAGAAVEVSRRDAVAAIQDLHATGSILAQTLSSDYAARQRTSLVGQTVESSQDLAVLAQLYRDPRFETFRVVFTGLGGKVVSQIGLTSRLPGSTSAIIGSDLDAYVKDLSRTAIQRGASGYYLLHNHPSGNPTPSRSDQLLTREFDARMPGLNFKGHVVIDTNQYSVIAGDGTHETFDHDFGQAAPMTSSQWGGTTFNGPQDVMAVARQMQVDDDAVTLIVTNSQYKVMSVATIPHAAITTDRDANRMMLTKAALQGKGSQLFAVGRNKMLLSRLSGSVMDAVYVSDTGTVASLAGTGAIGSGSPFPNDRRTRLSADTSPEFGYLRPFTMQQTQGQKVAEPSKAIKNMVTLHNLTIENLMHAADIGGIPVPSIGITKVDSAFNGFGEITLIAPKGMIDPANGVPVYDRDAYTARYPAMNFKKVSAKKADAFYERMQVVRALGYDGGFVSQVWDVIKNASTQNPDKVWRVFQQYDAPRMLYAKEVLGKTVKVPMKDVSVDYPWVADKAFAKTLGALQDKLMDYASSEVEASPEMKELSDAARAAIGRYVDKQGPDAAPDMRQDVMQAVAVSWGDRGEWATNPDQTMPWKSLDRIFTSARNSGKTEVDKTALSKRLDKLVPITGQAYADWAMGLINPLFDAPTITLRGKEVAPTLQNVVDAMTIGATAGSEKTMVSGPGKIAAMLGKRFKSLTEIQAARDQVVSEPQEHAGKLATNATLEAYRDRALTFYTEKDWRGQIDTWNGNDAAMDALALAGKAGLSDAAIRSALSRKGFKGMDQTTIDLARQSIDAIRSTATNYFEAKPQRAVKLNEFRGAVVPKGTSQEALDVLAANGIEVSTYNKNDPEAKNKALEKLARKVDKVSGDVLFSQGLLGPSFGPKPTLDEVNRLVARIQGVSKNVIPITVVGNPSQIVGVKVDVPAGVKPSGALINGQIYLFTDNLRSTGGVSVTIFHELFHLGLSKVIPAEDYAVLLGEFAKGPVAQGYINEWKKSPEGRQRAASMPSAAYEALANEEGLAIVSEALFADMGLGTKNLPPLVKEMVVWLAKTADKLGLPGNFSEWVRGLTRTDAEKFVSQMVRAAMGGDSNLAKTRRKFGTKVENLSSQTRLSSGGDQADTPAFKAWFGDSKVVNKDGTPRVMYTGTSVDKDFTQFKMAKNGVWFTMWPDSASDYAMENDSKGMKYNPDTGKYDEVNSASRVMPVYLSIKNPYPMTSADMQRVNVQNYKAAQAKLFEELRAKGFDGVQWSPAEWVAIGTSNQIKSAIGNNGDFSEKGDIRFAQGRSPQANLFQPTGWSMPDPTRTDRIIYELQDGRVDLKRAQAAIEQTGQQIIEKWDARLAETLYPGRVSHRSKAFLDSEVKPLLEAMARQNLGMNELADYLHARGAEERNKQIAKVNPAMPDGGAGTNTKGDLMTNQAARDYLASIRPARKQVLDAMAKRVDTITGGTRALLVTEGLEKQSTIDAWEGAYKNYVPMFRDEAEAGAPHPQGSGFMVRGSASKRATGSTKEVTNILAHVLMQREAAITRAEKNRVGLALYGQAMSHPNPEFWTTIKPSMKPAQIAAELMAMGVDPMTAQVGMEGVPTIRTVDPTTGKVVDRPNPMYKSLPGAITLRVNGEDRVLMLNQNNERAMRLAGSLKNLDGLTELDIAGSIVGQSTRWLASVNTQYNPAFGLVNVTRDTLGAAVNLGNTQLRGKSLEVLAKTPIAIVGIARELYKGGQGGKWQRLYREFQADGGQTGFRDNFRDPNERAKAIESELKGLGRASWNPTHAAHAILSLLDGFNTTLENAVRLSAYSAARDNGISRAKAARLGRELTVDFNRKGRLGREMGPLYAFFNAAVQGTARTMEAIKGPTGGRIVTGGLTLGALQVLALAMAGYEEDEIPEFVKTRALVIPMGADKDGTRTYITIPYPLGLHVIPNTGRVLAEMALNGGKDSGKRIGEAIGEIAGAFNPLGGGNIFTADGALKTLAPTVIDPLIEVGFNKNFSGNSIQREGYGGERDNRPGVARTKEATMKTTTGQAYMGISKAINSMTGGTDFEKGVVSPTPEMIRHLAQTVGGGVLRELEKTINSSTAASKGEPVKPSGIPVLGRFYGEVNDDQVQMSRYYRSSERIGKLQSTIKAMEKAEQDALLDKFEAANPESELIRDLGKTKTALSKLNRLAVETINNPKELAEIDADRLEEMRELNGLVKDLEKKSGKVTLADMIKPKAKSLVAAEN